MKGSYLGTEYIEDEIEKDLKSVGANFKTFDYEELLNKAVEFLANEKLLVGFKAEWNLVQEP